MRPDNLTIPKKMLIINDMAGFGRCSMTVALPVVSACKVQACPVPTSIFSNHTAFPTYFKQDLTSSMTEYLAHLSLLQVEFDGIYCGYLGSLEQMQIITDYMDTLSQKDARPVIVIDPVMGDHGCSYRNITPEFCEHMRSFITHADIITPNLTEACLLTQTAYHEGDWTMEELSAIARNLHLMGPKKVVITGIVKSSCFHNLVSEEDHCQDLSFPVSGESRPGTGDIFAGIVSALYIRGFSFSKAVSIAADFVSLCTGASSSAGLPVVEGVLFENYLHILTSL